MIMWEIIYTVFYNIMYIYEIYKYIIFSKNIISFSIYGYIFYMQSAFKRKRLERMCAKW